MISGKDALLQMASGPGLMDTVCDFIIRPPRCTYDMTDLGPEVFCIGNKGTQRFMRHDFQLENMRGMCFCCSWFKPYPSRRLPCVVYCHGNGGARSSALEALFLLEEGFSLFCFDFCGCGMSQGEYISLGFYERQDLVAVIDFLMLKSDEVDGVALWGRSMGAVAAIMYASKDPWIRCIVCDSPFASLRLLIDDLVGQYGGRAAQALPNIFLRGAVELIRKRIMKRAAFDIDDLNSMKYASACNVPALLFHGTEDDFVSPTHSEKIRDAFQIPCVQQFTPGGHNDDRDDNIQKLIAAFLRLYLVDKPQGARDMQTLQELAAANTGAYAVADNPTGAEATKMADLERNAKQSPLPARGRLRCVAATPASSSTTSASTSGLPSPTLHCSCSPIPSAASASQPFPSRKECDLCSGGKTISSETPAAPVLSSLPSSMHPGSQSGAQMLPDTSTTTATSVGVVPLGNTALMPSLPTQDKDMGV